MPDLRIEAKAAVTFKLQIYFPPAALLFNALLFYLYSKICTDVLAQMQMVMFPKMLRSGQYLKELCHPMNTYSSVKCMVMLY